MNLDYKYLFAIFLALVSLAATIWFAFFPPSTKSLTLTIASKSTLKTVSESKVPDLKVFVDETELKYPALTVLKLHNNGTIPVRSDDFESNIKILLDNGARPIRATAVETTPDWLKVIVAIDDSQVQIEPLLLNPGDSVTLNILSDGLPSSITTLSRVAGLSSITVQNEEKTNQTITAFFLFSAAFIIAIPMSALYSLLLEQEGIRLPLIFNISRRLWLTTVIVLVFILVALASSAAELLGVNTWWMQILIIYVTIALAIPTTKLLNHHPKESYIE